MFTGLLCQVRKPCGTNIEDNSAQLGNCVQVVMLPLHVDLYCTVQWICATKTPDPEKRDTHKILMEQEMISMKCCSIKMSFIYLLCR